jgi:hypothetical protein
VAITKEVWTGGFVLVNAVDLSNAASGASVTFSTPEVDVTAFGDAYMQYAGGIPDATIEVQYFQGQGAGGVDQTHFAFVGGATTFVVEVRRSSAARSTSNPGYVMTARMLGDYMPLQGSVGEALTTTVTYRNASQVGVQRLTA